MKQASLFESAIDRLPDFFQEQLAWYDQQPFADYIQAQEKEYGGREKFPKWLINDIKIRIDVLTQKAYWLAWLGLPPDTDRQTAISICKKVADDERHKLEVLQP